MGQCITINNNYFILLPIFPHLNKSICYILNISFKYLFFITNLCNLLYTMLIGNYFIFQMELSDFTMIETRLAALKVHSGLIEVLNTIRTR